MEKGVRKQAQEISYVIVRLAPFIRRKDLSRRLERFSFDLIEDVYSQDYTEAIKTIDIIQGLVALCANTGYMNLQNAQALVDKSQDLALELKERENYQEQEAIEFQAISPKLMLLPKGNQARKKKAKQSGNLPQSTPRRQSEEQREPREKAKNRQDRIVDFVEGSGSAQLKDVIQKFPDISERTLRYDLKQICERGDLVRQGKGGPANVYLPKGSSSAPEAPEAPQIAENSVSSTAQAPENLPIL